MYEGSALDILKTFDDESIDAIITDPPYGYSFMNRDWDRAVIGVETWKECLRVLKAGSFAAVMSSPRQDVLAKMIVNLQDAGFRTDFTSLYWTYASGFPKASNISKLVDKRNDRPYRIIELEKYLYNKIKEKYKNHKILAKEMNVDEALIRHWIGTSGTITNIPSNERYQELKEKLDLDNRFDDTLEQWRQWEEAEREIIGQSKNKIHFENLGEAGYREEWNITKSATEQAKSLDGSYGGFQPKPAIEIILMVMKPLSEKTFVDQALKNGKGVTWLDDGRIPFTETFSDIDVMRTRKSAPGFTAGIEWTEGNSKGRFPANLLVSDDVLNDGKVWRGATDNHKASSIYGNQMRDRQKGWGKENFGSYSRYFSFDAWFETTFPFIITPKPSPAEKNRGLDKWIPQLTPKGNYEGRDLANPKNHLGGMQSTRHRIFTQR